MRALIKDESIRKALRDWAIANQIEEVRCCIGDYDHGGFCAYDGVLEFDGIGYRLGIQFENRLHGKLKDGERYSILELVGEIKDEKTQSK